MAVLAHPDDESLGVGGTLAKYASEGVETFSSPPRAVNEVASAVTAPTSRSIPDLRGLDSYARRSCEPRQRCSAFTP